MTMGSPPPRITPHVQRVLQVDAGRLDEEAQASVQMAVARVTERLMRGLNLTPLSAPTTRLLLRLARHASATMRGVATAGLALQGLRLADGYNGGQPLVSVRRRALLSALCVLVPFLRTRVQSTHSATQLDPNQSSPSWSTRIQFAMRSLGVWLDIASALNLIMFLRYGVYPTMSHRLAGVTIAYDTRIAAPASRAAFQMVDQQLVWQGLARLAIALRPLLPLLSSVREMIMPVMMLSSSSTESTDLSSPDLRHRVDLQHCTICHNVPVMPHHAVPCGCVSCFVCAHSRATATCAQCGAPITAMRRVHHTE